MSVSAQLPARQLQKRQGHVIEGHRVPRLLPPLSAQPGWDLGELRTLDQGKEQNENGPRAREFL